ncbi:MAG: transglycosylase SLT domain-containing protein, partial [Pseudomonadaceae bacterium]|nr:transglycosylase SLT domain-containing protein [Pseudomonadaceae bacterium]
SEHTTGNGRRGGSKVSLGGLGGLLMKLPGVGMLGSLISSLSGRLGPALKLLGKAALPMAAIFSAYESFSTSTEEYAKRMGVELDGSLAQELGVRFMGVLGDFGNTLTFGLAGKFGEYIAPAVGQMVDGVVGRWKQSTDWLESEWSAGLAKFDGMVKSLSDMVDGAGKWIAEKLDAGKKKVAQVVAPVVQAAKSAETKINDGYESAKEAAIVSGGRLVGRLNKGYRHQESFEGVQGGSSLAKNGRYTNGEADRIRELKASGANTGGQLKGGMPLPVQNKIIEQATQAGLDPQAMLEIAAVESGGNANAISSTGAIGVYQMTGGTASGLGITDRFDVDQNIAGGMKLAQENAATLKQYGLPATRDNLYMMHQLGPKAAREVIMGAESGKSMSQLSIGTQTAAGFNIGKGSKTASQYLAANSAALDAKVGKVRAAMPVPSAPAPSADQVVKTVPTVPPLLAPIAQGQGAGQTISRWMAPVAPTAPPLVATAPRVTSVAPPADRQTVPPAPSAPRKVASNE